MNWYSIFPEILNMSLTASVVILFVLIARFFMKNMPKIYSYVLWTVVLFRLLCPVSLSSDFSLLGMLEAPSVSNGSMTSSVKYVPSDIMYVENSKENFTISEVDEHINYSLPQAQEQFSEEPSDTPISFFTCIWMIGVVTMLGYGVVSYFKLRNKLVGAIHIRDNIYMADHISSPFVMGIFCPRIYLLSSLGEKEQDYIILHEKQHIRRLDHIVKVVAYMALCIHWFNPLVWIAFVLFTKDMEMSCDEAVIRMMGEEIRADYSASLLSFSIGQRMRVSTSITFGECDTKGRIKNLARQKRPAIGVTIVAVIVCVLIIWLSALNPDEEETFTIWKSEAAGYLTEDGYFFTRDAEDNSNSNMLWYFDIKSGNTVLVCNKAECAHQAVDLSLGERPSCNAQIDSNDIVVYKDKVYYLSGEDMKVVLRRRDMDGNNDEKVAVIDATYMGNRMWFYRDQAFIMAATGVSESFDPETRESDDSVMRLFVADLNSGKTEILAESSLAEKSNNAFTVYEMEDGKVSFYDLEKDKWYIYEIENSILKEQKDIVDHAIYGTAGEYWYIWKDYGYTFFEDGLGNTSIVCKEWKTGKESTIYTGESGSILGYHLIHEKDCMYITEDNWETGFKKICFYDMETGEMKQAGGEFLKDIKNGFPIIVSDKGFIYRYAVNQTKDDDVYAGDFEYRYMSLEDMLVGNDRYQVVYYLDQEE